MNDQHKYHIALHQISQSKTWSGLMVLLGSGLAYYLSQVISVLLGTMLYLKES